MITHLFITVWHENLTVAGQTKTEVNIQPAIIFKTILVMYKCNILGGGVAS